MTAPHDLAGEVPPRERPGTNRDLLGCDRLRQVEERLHRPATAAPKPHGPELREGKHAGVELVPSAGSTVVAGCATTLIAASSIEITAVSALIIRASRSRTGLGHRKVPWPDAMSG